jgi:hypothetical protein
MRETINRSSISRAVLHERGRAIADAIAEAITLITLNKRRSIAVKRIEQR